MKSPGNVVVLPSVRVIAATFILAALASLGAFASRPASIRVDGNRVVSDVPPVTRAHETYLPLRPLVVSLGGRTTYDRANGSIEVIVGNRTLRMRVGHRKGTLDGIAFVADHPPFVVRGRVMVASQLVARVFSSRTHYDAARANIDVTTPKMIDASAQEPPQP